MNIHPLWFICIFFRLSLIFVIRYIHTQNDDLIHKITASVLLVIGLGFTYQGYFGSNNEIQIANVFWHDARYIHAVFYILASIYLFRKNININTILLITDLIFSILYRLINNK